MKPVNTMTITQMSLVPALNIGSSGTLTTSRSVQIQTMKAASARTTMMTRAPSDDTFELRWNG